MHNLCVIEFHAKTFVIYLRIDFDLFSILAHFPGLWNPTLEHLRIKL